MTRRRPPDWFPAILGVVIGGAIMFGFMFHVLDRHDSANRDRERNLQAQIDQNKEALARANAERIANGQAPIIIMTPPSGPSSSTTTRPTSPPTVASTTTTSSTVAPRPPCLVIPPTIPILGSIPGVACSR